MSIEGTPEHQSPQTAGSPPSSEPVGASPSADVTPSASPSLSEQEIADLRARADAYNQLASTLSPYKEDIARFVEDEDYRKFQKQSYEAYQQLLKQQQPPVPPEVAAFRDEIAPVKSYVEDLRKREEAAQQAEQQKFIDENAQYIKRLSAERPELTHQQLFGIAAYADTIARAENRPVGVEEAYKRLQGFAPATSGTEAPPRSLRADAGAPGVPGKSTLNADQRRERISTDFSGYVTDLVRGQKSA